MAEPLHFVFSIAVKTCSRDAIHREELHDVDTRLRSYIIDSSLVLLLTSVVQLCPKIGAGLYGSSKYFISSSVSSMSTAAAEGSVLEHISLNGSLYL